MESMYEAYEIRKGIWHIKECLSNPGFMTLVEGKEKALLFDTGYGSGDLRTFVEKLTDKPIELVLSHGHFDHACAAWQFDYAWLHPADFELARTGTGKETRSRRWGVNTRHADAEPDIPRGRGYLPYINDGCCELRELGEHQIFDLGGRTAEVIPVPGHTLGSVGLLLREDRIYLAGDSANPTFFLFVENSGTWDNHKDNMRKLLDLPFDHFLIGHRPTVFPKERIKGFLRTAENADPSTDRIHIMGPSRPWPVYRAQDGADEDPESNYMLYRGDQIPARQSADWDGETAIVADAAQPLGLLMTELFLQRRLRVFAWTGRTVPEKLRQLQKQYGPQLRIFEEVLFGITEFVENAADIAAELSCGNVKFLAEIQEDLEKTVRERFPAVAVVKLTAEDISGSVLRQII